MAYNQDTFNYLKKLIEKGNSGEFITTLEGIRAIENRTVLNEYLYGRYDKGYSLLSWASMEDNTTDIINYLIKTVRVDVNQSDLNGRTALYMAVDRGQVDNARLLIMNKADIDTSDNHEGQTLLHVASEPNDNSEELIELLCASGAKYTTNKNGDTPLHTAAKYNIKAMKALIKYKGDEIDINKQDNDGDTPLHRAAESETGHNATYLLQLGANRTIKNKDGKTSAQVADNWDPEGVDWEAIIGYKHGHSYVSTPEDSEDEKEVSGSSRELDELSAQYGML